MLMDGDSYVKAPDGTIPGEAPRRVLTPWPRGSIIES